MERDEVPLIARRQGGVFTSRQAVEAGWTVRQVRRRQDSGRWVRVAGRALGPADLSERPLSLAWAARLTWPKSIICRRTAAGVHGFPVPAGDAEALVGHGHSRLYRLRPHTVSLGADPAVTVHGLKVTDRRSTAIDCLAFLPLYDALDLFAWLSSRQELDRDAVAATARMTTHRWGVGQLRRLLDLTRCGAVSAAEHLLHQLLRAARITGWEAAASVTGSSGHRAVADVLFRTERVLIEVDGERAHAGRTAFVQDRRRQNDLVTAGFLILRFTWWDLTERPETVIRQIRQALSGA